MSVTGKGQVSAGSSVVIMLSILVLVLATAFFVRPLVQDALGALAWANVKSARSRA